MTRMGSMARCAVVGAAIALAGWPAQAVPITQLSSVVTQYLWDDGTNTVSVTTPINNTNGAAASSSVTAPANAFGAVNVSASADLATGTLRAAAAVSATGVADSIVFGAANARIGDGLRTGSPTGPFTWTPGNDARFTFDISGSITGSPDFGGTFLSLFLFEAGTLDTVPTQSTGLIGGRGVAWTFGPQNQVLTNATVLQNFDTVPTAGLTIDYTFNPGGDFDWLLVFSANGGLFGNDGADSLVADFGSTVHVSYSGPAGATTTSVSGLFGPITDVPAQVPEPSTVALVLAASCAAFVRRRGTLPAR